MLWTISIFGFILLIKLFQYLQYSVPTGDAMGDGFGPTKRLITFHMEDRNIPPTDKRRAAMTISENGVTNTYDIGIEIKGSGLDERPKLNLAVEIWDCSEECEDDKEELFDFGEKYEDYVLRGGWGEQTMTRGEIASRMVGGLLQRTLVEVLFDINGTITYEGVYQFMPAIQRRYLEKTLGWSEKGKAEECDDEDLDIEHTSMIAEFTIASKGRKEPCEGLPNIKMRYPKCPVEACYDDRLSFINLFSMINTSEVPINLDSFVHTYIAEIMLREDDFPYTSQYFYLDPDGITHSGPRWDYDRNFWKVAPESWDLINLNYYSRGPIDFWVHLGTYEPFLEKVRNSVSVIQQNLVIAEQVIDERLAQYEAGYFDNEIKKWGMYGKQTDPNTNHIIYAVYGQKVFPKKNMKEELEFMRQKFRERAQWMIDNPVQTYGVHNIPLALYIVIDVLTPFLIAGIVLIILSKIII